MLQVGKDLYIGKTSMPEKNYWRRLLESLLKTVYVGQIADVISYSQ